MGWGLMFALVGILAARLSQAGRCLSDCGHGARGQTAGGWIVYRELCSRGAWIRKQSVKKSSSPRDALWGTMQWIVLSLVVMLYIIDLIM